MSAEDTVNDPESLMILRNLTKNTKQAPKNKALTKAIEKSDLEFIAEFLTFESRMADVCGLSKTNKCKLLPLLLEFVDQPLRIEAINCIYEIMTDVGNVDAFSRVLIERSVDFNKLVFLKGKIDYLKYLSNKSNQDTAENEYSE